MTGDQAVNSFIRSWKRSYLGHINAWPSESIIAKIVQYAIRLDPTYTHANSISDGEVMAQIVSRMRKSCPNDHQAFVAFHLRLVDGRRYPKCRDYQLAKMLDITPKTFRARRDRAFEFARIELESVLHLPPIVV